MTLGQDELQALHQVADWIRDEIEESGHLVAKAVGLHNAFGETDEIASVMVRSLVEGGARRGARTVGLTRADCPAELPCPGRPDWKIQRIDCHCLLLWKNVIDGHDFILPRHPCGSMATGFIRGSGAPQCTTFNTGPCRRLMLMTSMRLPSMTTLPEWRSLPVSLYSKP